MWATRRRAPTTTPSRRALITRTPSPASWSFFAGANVQYLSKAYWYIDNLDVQNSKTYTNARFAIKNERWTATIWGRNIFDTRAYDTYDPNQATGSAATSDIPISRHNMVLRLYIDFDERRAAVFPHQPLSGTTCLRCALI